MSAPVAGQHRNEALDGVRAVAISGVLLSHVGVPHTIGGAIGVQIFFVLSGYLITAILLREHHTSGRIRLRQFAARRVLRLLPALTVVLLVWVGWLLTHPGTAEASQTLRGVVPSMLYYANWVRFAEGDSALGWLAPMWSLAVEEQFYLLWPVALLLLLRRGSLRLMLAVIALSCAAALAFRFQDLWTLDQTYRRFGTHQTGDQLLIGCALALLLDRGSPGLRHHLAASSHGLIAPAVLLLLLVTFTMEEAPSLAFHRFIYTVGLTLIGLSAAVLLARIVIDDRCWTARLLAAGPLPWIGRRSYAIYLWHEFFRMVATNGRSPGTAVLLLVVATGSLVAASLSYALVERPFLLLKSRLSTPEPAAPAQLAPPTVPEPGVQQVHPLPP